MVGEATGRPGQAQRILVIFTLKDFVVGGGGGGVVVVVVGIVEDVTSKGRISGISGVRIYGSGVLRCGWEALLQQQWLGRKIVGGCGGRFY